MAILRKNDIRKMEKNKIVEKIRELRLEIAKQKANIHIGATVSSPGKLKEMKKTVARLLTILKEKHG